MKSTEGNQLQRSCGGKWEAKVGLGEGGHNGAKDSSELRGSVRGNGNRKEGGFVVVDGEPSSKFEELKSSFSGNDGIGRTVEEDQSVISVLKNGTRQIRSNGVVNTFGKRRVLE
jgi:hypothetical protein